MSISNRNNSTDPSSSSRCNCGRLITIGEEKAGMGKGVFKYVCPDCTYREHEERYYDRFGERDREAFDNYGLY